jgi:hypothetical protein
MAYEIRDNSASLFKNDRKETENHPNAKGSAMVGGVHYWVSAWTKTDKNGNKWQSLSFTPKDDRPAQAKPDQRMDAQNRASMAAQAPADFDDDVPF